MGKLLNTLGLLVLLALAPSVKAEAAEKANYSIKPSTSSYSVNKSTSAYNMAKSTQVAKPEISKTKNKKSDLLDKLSFEVGAGIEQMAKSPAQDYIESFNQDLADGVYTFKAEIHGLKPIETPSSTTQNLEASILYDTDKIVKNTKAGIVIGTGQSNLRSDYNESYDVGTDYIPFNFNRKENININSSSIGAKVKARLKDWLSGFLTLKQENYKVNGNVDYSIHVPETDYTQWRDMNYSGSGTANSIEAGLNFDITKNVSVGFTLGSRGCEVKTSGKQVITLTSDPNWSATREYSPEFGFDSSYGKADIIVKF